MKLQDFAGPQAIAIIAGLVEVLKKFGVPSDWCLVGAIAVGIALLELVQLAAYLPDLAPWIEAGLSGLIYGLTATGLYMLGKRWMNKG